MSSDDTIAALIAQNAELIKILSAREPPVSAAPVRPTSPLFSDVAERYWKVDGQHLGTPSDVRRQLDRLIAKWGNKECLDLSDELAEDFRAEFKAENTRYGEPPSAAYVNAYLARARRVLNWAVSKKPPLIPYNPLAKVRMEEEDNIQQTNMGTEEELERLIGACTYSSLGKPATLKQEYQTAVIQAYIILLADSGGRRMVGLKLRWDLIEWSTGRINKPKDVRKKKRWGKPRLTERAKVALRKIEALYAQLNPTPSEFVFTNPKTGKPYNKRHLYRMFERGVDRSGLKGVDGESITLHTLRRRWTYRARVVLKIPVRTAMAIQGHTTMSTHERYGWVDEEEADEASEAMEQSILRELERSGGKRGPKAAPSLSIVRSSDDKSAASDTEDT